MQWFLYIEHWQKFLFVADTETSTISTKKGKKKKKKTTDKNNKQNLDKNGSDLSNKMSEIDEDKMEPLKSDNKNQDKNPEVKGNASRSVVPNYLEMRMVLV